MSLLLLFTPSTQQVTAAHADLTDTARTQTILTDASQTTITLTDLLSN